MIAAIVLSALTAFFAAAAIISYMRISHGAVRVFAFPRLQMVACTLALAAATIWLVDDPDWRWILFVVQLAVIAAHTTSIAQFTPLRRAESAKYEGRADDPNTFAIMSYNVKQSNRRYRDAISLTHEVDPDLALFMETDADWCGALDELKLHYPHSVVEPIENSYGMALYSKLELVDAKVCHLVMEDVPSIIARVVLRDGNEFRLYCVHPEPPVPYADSAGRDAELLKVAELVDDDEMPSVVCGDLNDVAWSHTTRLFQRMSRMADPRIGRGFYNTFDARYPFLRWPLDHLFHDARFALVEMRRLRHIGSDHFPIFFRLALTPNAEGSLKPERADRTDREEAEGIYEDAEEIDRPAIGSDWEK